MYFNMPTRLYEEKGCVINHSKDIAVYGDTALIVTGRRSSKINGSLNDVRSALEKEKITYIIFDEVEENPSVETVMKATTIGIDNKVDFVIGLGGGSPIDAAKAIAIMVANPDETSDYLYENIDAYKLKALPIIAVPTTCGTGSEVTGVAVLTVHSKRTKASLPHRVFPKLALLDAEYLKETPKSIIKSTAIDALGHLIESYINTTSTEYSRIFVRQGLSLWAKCKPVLADEKEPDQDDFRNLLNASTMGGMAIAHTGTTIPHSLSYSVTYELGVPHGIAIGYFLAGYLREADSADRDFVLQQTGFDTVDVFEKFFQQATGCTALPSDILNRVVDAVSKNKAKLDLCPYYLDRDVLKRIAKL